MPVWEWECLLTVDIHAHTHTLYLFPSFSFSFSLSLFFSPPLSLKDISSLHTSCSSTALQSLHTAMLYSVCGNNSLTHRIHLVTQSHTHTLTHTHKHTHTHTHTGTGCTGVCTHIQTDSEGQTLAAPLLNLPSRKR